MVKCQLDVRGPNLQSHNVDPGRLLHDISRNPTIFISAAPYTPHLLTRRSAREGNNCQQGVRLRRDGISREHGRAGGGAGHGGEEGQAGCGAEVAVR